MVRSAAALDAALAADKVAFMHCVEGGFHLGATPAEVEANVAELKARGVVYVTLAHLFWRDVATDAPAIPMISDDVYRAVFEQPEGVGLTELGEAAVKAMYRERMLIDLSHMSERSLADTFALLDRLDAESGDLPTDHPVIASHAGYRFGEQEYMVSPDAIGRIAARGGVIGLIMARHQLNDGDVNPDPDALAGTAPTVRRTSTRSASASVRRPTTTSRSAPTSTASSNRRWPGSKPPPTSSASSSPCATPTRMPTRSSTATPCGSPLGARLKSALKVATAIVGLLAGLVAAVYMLGGIVIALRLLYHHASIQGVVTAVGQLPRDSVVATALLNVIAPAAGIGLLLAVVYGLVGWPKERPAEASEKDDDLLKGKKKGHRLGTAAIIVAIAVVGTLPGLHVALHNDGFTPLLFGLLYGAIVTAGIAAACFYAIRWAGSRPDLQRIGRAAVAGALWAVIAIVPMTMLAGAKTSERAQVCTTPGQPPVKGRLIGQSSERLLLEENFNKVEAIVAIPTEEVTESEYGDLSSTFVCPATPRSERATLLAEARLGPTVAPRSECSRPSCGRACASTARSPGDRSRSRPSSTRATSTAAMTKPADARDPRRSPLTKVDELSRGRGTPDFIDIHGDRKNGVEFKSPYPRCRGPIAVDCNAGPSAVIYYRRTSHEGRWYWDYWWFSATTTTSGTSTNARSTAPITRATGRA